ncbi:MAG: hypothetical protein H6732_05775 [Alphaproteobacteria bacterium]|nr:hypothetical protein [Alphaproteobacteria bacterium]
MSRWFSPIALFGLAAYVHHHNSTQEGSTIVVPFAEALAGPSHQAQGEVSVQVLAALGVLFLALAIRDLLRSRAAEEGPEEAP